MRLFGGFMAGLLATAGPRLLDAQDTLRVLRHVPGDSASPSSTVTIMFDRPVAGALDSTVSAAGVFHMTPRVAGSIAWRDPITIRFVPSEPLVPGVRYTVGIDTTLRAVDGARLGAPYQFDFRVAGPRLLARSFDGYWGDDTLAPDGRVRLLYSAPVDLDRLARGVRVELSGCAGGGPGVQPSIMLRPLGQHPLGPRDPSRFQYAAHGDSISGRFTTVVELEPVSRLPLECGARVVVPTTTDDAAFGTEERYSVRTAPAFRFLPPDCSREGCSPAGTLIRFSSPVNRADVLKHVHLNDEPLLLGASGEVAKQWTANALLVARSTYTVRIDSALRDIYGRPIEGPRTFQVLVDDQLPQLSYQRGILTIPRSGPLSLPIRSVNVRTARLIAYSLPDSVRMQVMGTITNVVDPMQWLRKIAPETSIVALPDRLNADTVVDVPVPRAALAPSHPLIVFRFEIADSLPEIIPRSVSRARHAVVLTLPEVYTAWYSPFAMLQVTDLAVTARLVGATAGSALVSGLGDGRPRRGVTVSQFDPWRRLIGRGVTDERGVATLERVAPDSVLVRTSVAPWTGPRFNVLQAETSDDRVTVSLGGRAIGFTAGSQLQPEVLGGRSGSSPLAAGAVFTDRGIYRPGEVVHLKGVVRRGMLGALHLPSSSDSARITVRRDERSWLDDTTLVVRDTVGRLTSFGTLVDSVRLRPGLTLDNYTADVSVVVDGKWRTIGSTSFRLAEYRAPNFLVELSNDTTTHYAGDTIEVAAVAHLLFGAPLRGGQVRWTARMYEGSQPRPRGIGYDWAVGDQPGWRGVGQNGTPPLSGVATLDTSGRARIRLPVAALTKHGSGDASVSVGITDVDQQVVTEQTSVMISSSRTYILARLVNKASPWRIGKPALIQLRTVDENGASLRGVTLRAVTLWRHTRRGDPYTNTPSVQSTDTVSDRRLALDRGEGMFSFIPDSSGEYAVVFSARDSRDGPATTTIVHAVAGSTVARTPFLFRAPPSGFRLALTADSTTFAVGDVAHVHFDSPFADAEAWITMEREGVIEERRQRASRGDNVADLRIGPSFEPNVFVSVVLVARDERARPDSARQRLRAGYLELNVTSDRRKLSVALAPDRTSYLPRDSAAIRVRVRDASGKGVRSEVAVWAVDEGVLALTGFTTPDIRSRIYAPRGINNVLWSTLPTLVTNDPMLSVVFLQQSAVMLNEVVMTASVASSVSTLPASPPTVRSHFASTAFYLGRVETDEQGNAVARAPVPDNLTTFRVMAVATSPGDQYGFGDTTLLVTRPLVARAALPRFVRPSDSLIAGVVVTARDGRPRQATTEASVAGAALRGPTALGVALTRTASSEARFVIQTPTRDRAGDTVTVQLGANDGVTADATETRLLVRPDFHPRTHAVLGAVRDSQTLALTLPPDIDPERSRLRLRIGTSQTSAMLAAYRWLRAYPYDCSEQLSSVGRALIAVWRATKNERTDALGGDPHATLQELVDEISKRQREDGAIKYWPNWYWSSPWLSSYAGIFLLDARDAGVKVDPSVIRRIGRYLDDYSKQPVATGGMNRYERQGRRLALGYRVAMVDFLRRAGEPDSSTERELLRVAGLMTWEDRLRLAEVIGARKDMRSDAEAIVDAAWRVVTPAGHRVDLPDSSHGPRDFPSRIAPAARLLSASLELRPSQPMLGGLVETVLQQGRAESGYSWSTQDYASVVMALAQFRDNDAPDRVVSARAGASSFVAHPPKSGVDTTITAPLTGMLETTANGQRVLRVHVDASAGERPVYYALEVDEVPLEGPVKPDIQGLVVERWYERFDNGAPVTRVSEGDLVRVRLRITAPADREFVAVEDPLPAGLEPIDLGLRTTSLSPFTTPESELAREAGDRDRNGPLWQAVLYGGWDDGHWSPWEHKELHDDRVSYFARMLWTGSYTASYVARATTAGSFVAPPAYSEEMYNPALQGRSSGGRFLIDVRP